MTVTNVFNSSQQFLFGRAYALAIGAGNTPSALQYSNFSVRGTNGQVQAASPLRIKFDIDRNSFGTSNKSKVEIYNLSVESRSKIKKGYVLRLQAGYNGLIKTIFLGNIPSDAGFFSKRDGADIITSMEVLDGGNAISYSILDRSYAPGTSLAFILKDLAGQMDLTLNGQPGIGQGTILGIPNIVYNNGYHINGTVADSLRKLLKNLQIDWSIQSGNLTILPKTLTNGQPARVISVETGMIGVPSDNGQFLQFTSLLNPNLVPGTLVQMVSENISLNGFYKINRAHFEGDTHDTKWQVACECIRQTNISNTAASGFNGNTTVTSNV